MYSLVSIQNHPYVVGAVESFGLSLITWEIPSGLSDGSALLDWSSCWLVFSIVFLLVICSWRVNVKACQTDIDLSLFVVRVWVGYCVRGEVVSSMLMNWVQLVYLFNVLLRNLWTAGGLG